MQDAWEIVEDFCKRFKLGEQKKNITTQMRAGRMVTKGRFEPDKRIFAELVTLIHDAERAGYRTGWVQSETRLMALSLWQLLKFWRIKKGAGK